jgi:hypothetical protein
VSIRGFIFIAPASAMLLLGACRTVPPANPPDPVAQRDRARDEQDAARIRELKEAADEAKSRETRKWEPAPSEEALAARRIAGRRTLEVMPGLTVYADQQKSESDHKITLTDSIFVDGTATESHGKRGPRIYGEKAVWDPVTKHLVVSGRVAYEQNGIRVAGATPETYIDFDVQKDLGLGVVGPVSSTVSIKK